MTATQHSKRERNDGSQLRKLPGRGSAALSSEERTSTVTPRGAARPDPMEPVRHLGDSVRLSAGVLALIGSLGTHALFGAASASSLDHLYRFASGVQRFVDERLQISYDIDVEEPEPPPEPEPEPEPEPPPEPEPEPEPEPPPEPVDVATPEEPPTSEPPPAPAEAGKVLTAPADPDEPLDLTGEGFISGEGTRFAGGTTSAKGTSTKAVRSGAARPDGVPDGRGKVDAPPAPTVDRSRPAKPIATSLQNCPWPAEADIEQINYTRVRLMVIVGADGRAKDVRVLDDPGSGFGTAVKRCAMNRGRFEAPLDKMGRPTSGSTPPFVITFRR